MYFAVKLNLNFLLKIYKAQGKGQICMLFKECFKTGIMKKREKEHFPEILKSASVYCIEPKANRSFGEGAHPTWRLRELLGKLYKIHISQLYPCANQQEISFVQ